MKLRALPRIRDFVRLLLLLLLIVAATCWVMSPDARATFNRLARNDIYDPVSDEFQINLWEKGATVTFSFTPPFTNEYVLGLIFKEKTPHFFFKPQGIYYIRYYREKKLVREHLYMNHKPDSGDLHGKAPLIVLDVFVLPQEWGEASHTVELTVLEPDLRLKEYKDSMRIIVSGSPYW